MNKIKFAWLALLFISIVAAAFLIFSGKRAEAPGITTSTNKIIFDFKNAPYVIDGRTYTLTNGVSEIPAAPGSASKITTRYFGNEAYGDLNEDGKSDTAFLIAQETGGSGTFYYAVVALKAQTGYTLTNTIFIGDRIAPQSTVINTNTHELDINYADRKPGEPMTAQPSVGITKVLQVTQEGILIDKTLSSWKTAKDAATGLTFKYPENLSTQYMNALDWPPQLQMINEPFTCTEAGAETDRAGKTEKRLVDNRFYCVTKKTEGAAGSIYTLFSYAFPWNGKTAIFTFSTRAVQCGNYADPQKTACEGERETFDLDSIIDKIAQSIQ